MKNLLKNPFVIAGIVIGISAVVKLIIKLSTASEMALLFFTAVGVSYLYSREFNEKMPGELRRNAAIIFFLVQILVTVYMINRYLDVYSYYGLKHGDSSILYGLMIGINVFYTIVVYFFLGINLAPKAQEEKAVNK